METKPVILVVDDEPKNIELLEAHLAPQGYEIIKADNGKEALAQLGGDQVDLILLDVMMPGMDGYEVCRALKKKTGYLPVIMITSLGDRDSRLKGIECGADDFLSKPFDSAELKLKIKNLLKIKYLYGKVENNCREIKALSGLKDDLTTFIIHDLRTPLTGIIGFLDLLLMSSDLTEPDRNDVEKTKQNSVTMLGMICDLQSMNKMENKELVVNAADCDLGSIVSSSVRVLLPMLNVKAIGLLDKTVGSGMRVRVQKDLIGRVVQNLVSNAIRYTPRQGIITIECEKDESSGMASVSISDSGTGVPGEQKLRIFDKYVTVESKNKRMSGSSGLGLAFCKLAVELHGGKIWVEDRSGGGSIFRFTLPVPGVK